MGATYYASGSNHAGEIAGLAEIGHAIGVAAPEVSEAALEALLGTGGAVEVFVDSGAFSEVTFGANGPEVVEPITDARWQKVLGLYRQLGAELGAALTVVAPDKVGFAADTIERLRRYAADVREIAALGVQVLVPLQGADKAAFWTEAQAALGMAEADGLVPALPCKKNATSPAEVVAFVRQVAPRRVHLLGLGAANPAAAGILQSVGAATRVTLDSNLIRANVGRGVKRRKLTAANDAVADVLAYLVWREVLPAGAIGQGFDYTDSICEPSGWMTPAALRRMARELGLEAGERRELLADVDAFVADRSDCPLVELALDAEWAKFAAACQTAERKRQSIIRAFGPQAPTTQLGLFAA